MVKKCIKCHKEFYTRGKELVCSPLCKAYLLVDSSHDCWFLPRYNSNNNPKIRYKSYFYDSRKLLFFKNSSFKQLSVCKLNSGCINPSHQQLYSLHIKPDEKSFYKRCVDYISSWLVIKEKY